MLINFIAILPIVVKSAVIIEFSTRIEQEQIWSTDGTECFGNLLTFIDLPQEMKRAMAKQAEAERERRAKVINSKGEFESAQKLSEAAEIMEKHPATLQLRYLHTLSEISANKNAMTVFPLPMEMLQMFARNKQ